MITLLASSLHPTLSPQTITWWWHLEVRTKHFQHCCIFFHKEGRQRLLFSPALGHPGRLQDCRCSRRSEQNAPFEVRSAWNCQASNQWRLGECDQSFILEFISGSNSPFPRTRWHFASKTSGAGNWGGEVFHFWSNVLCDWFISDLISI